MRSSLASEAAVWAKFGWRGTFSSSEPWLSRFCERISRKTRVASRGSDKRRVLPRPSIIRTFAPFTRSARPLTASSSSPWSTSGATHCGVVSRPVLSPVREALDIAVQIVSALNIAHGAGVVHRDLKPENVMLRPDGLVKVVDFGLAKLAPVQIAAAEATLSVARTDAGTVVGTVAYMSPEQARGQDVDPRTDVWSLGVLLYEMITGRNPFAGESSSDTLAAILDREPAPIARFEPDAPRELQRMLSKTLRKDREQRYQGMKDVLLDLQALRSESAIQTESNAFERERTEPEVTSVAAATMVRSESSAEYVVRQIARHKLGLALSLCAFMLIVGTGWWTLFRRPFAPHDTPSIAVLPFSTIGAGDGYFADGITEAVTTELGRVGGLRVIASNTAFGYREKTAFQEVGRELGVGLVVRGSVQRAGGTVRIDVSLVDTRNATALWSEQYSRDVTDVLAVQDDISRQIATTLSKTVGAQATAGSPSLATRNPEAYDAYLRGVWHLKGRSSATMSGGARRFAAIEELERAVAHDSNFALARAGLASAYTQRFFYDATDPVVEQKAFLEIQRALALNPNQAEAYLARAQLTWNLRNGFPHEQAVSDLRRALSINPNLAEAYVELGKVYYHIGLTDKAVEVNEQAQRLDPSEAASRIRRFLALVDAGRLEEVAQELDRSTISLGAYPRGDALVSLGRFEEALQVLSASSSEASNTAGFDRGPQFAAFRGVVYASLGRREDAERMLAATIPAAENTSGLSHVHHAQFHIGATLGLLGRHDEAVRWLTKAADEGYPSYPRFSTDRSLAPLKGHAGFEALLSRLRKDRDHWQRRL